jgi:DNA ligase-1
MKLIPNLYIRKCLGGLHGMDGELMVKGDFNSVQSGVMSVEGEPDFTYHVYDNWTREDSDWKKLRRVKGYSKFMTLVSTRLINSPEEMSDYIERCISAGYEGAVSRSIHGGYKQGRSTPKEGLLLKLKRFDDSEGVIIGFEEKMKNTNEKKLDERGYAKRTNHKSGMVPAGTLGAIILDWNGITVNVGTGFDDKLRQEVWDNRESYMGGLVTFKYQGVSEYGVPRFPTFKGFRKEFE